MSSTRFPKTKKACTQPVSSGQQVHYLKECRASSYVCRTEKERWGTHATSPTARNINISKCSITLLQLVQKIIPPPLLTQKSKHCGDVLLLVVIQQPTVWTELQCLPLNTGISGVASAIDHTSRVPTCSRPLALLTLALGGKNAARPWLMMCLAAPTDPQQHKRKSRGTQRLISESTYQ